MRARPERASHVSFAQCGLRYATRPRVLLAGVRESLIHIVELVCRNSSNRRRSHIRLRKRQTVANRQASTSCAPRIPVATGVQPNPTNGRPARASRSCRAGRALAFESAALELKLSSDIGRWSGAAVGGQRCVCPSPRRTARSRRADAQVREAARRPYPKAWLSTMARV